MHTEGVHPRVVRMAVIGPDGEELPWWTHSALVDARPAVAPVDLALNAEPGEYSVAATDVVTGHVADRQFRVAAD